MRTSLLAGITTRGPRSWPPASPRPAPASARRARLLCVGHRPDRAARCWRPPPPAAASTGSALAASSARRACRPAIPPRSRCGWRTCPGCRPGCCSPRTPCRTRSAPGRGTCSTRSSGTASRELTYPLRSDLRGKFEIGPLQLRVADSFGLVELSRSLSGRTTFVVTPRVVPLAAHRDQQLLGGRRRGPGQAGVHGRRGRRHPARLPRRGRAAAGALAVDGQVRRAHGAPGGAALAQQGDRAAGQPVNGAYGQRAGVLVRGGG